MRSVDRTYALGVLQVLASCVSLMFVLLSVLSLIGLRYRTVWDRPSFDAAPTAQSAQAGGGLEVEERAVLGSHTWPSSLEERAAGLLTNQSRVGDAQFMMAFSASENLDFPGSFFRRAPGGGDPFTRQVSSSSSTRNEPRARERAPSCAAITEQDQRRSPSSVDDVSAVAAGASADPIASNTAGIFLGLGDGAQMHYPEMSAPASSRKTILAVDHGMLLVVSVALACKCALVLFLQTCLTWCIVIADGHSVAPLLEGMLVENVFEHSQGVFLLLITWSLFDNPLAKVLRYARDRHVRYRVLRIQAAEMNDLM